MEFLVGRSLANNVMNLLLDPITEKTVKDENLDWLRLLDQEPDAGLGDGGLGRLAACFLTIAEYATDIWNVTPCPVR
jgi:starch phosphorylase